MLFNLQFMFLFLETQSLIKRFECPKKCGRSYKRKQYVDRHLKYECGVSPKYHCSICERKFAYPVSLNKHYVLVHKLITI